MYAEINNVVDSRNDVHGVQIRCFITGGNTKLVLKQLTAEFEHEPDLVLHGLAVFSGLQQ